MQAPDAGRLAGQSPSRGTLKQLILLLAAAAAFGALPVGADSPAAARPPNILLILADDLGREWFGCCGSEEDVTPNIDRLATQGARFETCWATPLCTPTRLELLTGRYPFRTGWVDHHDTPRWGGRSFDPAQEVCAARPLRDAGYATAIAGKWQVNDLRDDPQILSRHGFDRHCVWPGAEKGAQRDTERYWNPFVQTDGRRLDHPEAFGPDLFSGYLENFIRERRDRPFFAYYPMVLTHEPLTTTPHNRSQDLQDRHAAFAGMVRYLDHQVGRLLKALDESGQRDNTLVIFTTDNGSPRGSRARWNGRTVAGGKGLLGAWGTQLPLLIRWPGIVRAGRVISQPVDFSDLFPTLLQAAGAAPPPGVILDGKSFLPLLRLEKATGRDWIFSQYGDQRVIGDGRYRLYSRGAFFDLQSDPMEEHDLAAVAGGPAAAARDRLSSLLHSLPEGRRLPGRG